VDLTLAFVTDVHVGPEARFEGKLRKLSHRAPELLARFVERMNETVRPDAVVHLGDAIEDEGSALDRERYQLVVDTLGKLRCPVFHVAGNHDSVHLSDADLLEIWGQGSERTHYARDIGGYRLVALHTHEIKDQRVFVEEAQLVWLEAELCREGPPVILVMHHSAADQVLLGNRWFEGRPHICLVQERKRLREIVERSGRVLCVVNGHLHWNQLTVHGGVPYVTVQSLIENLDDDAPGRPAAAHGLLSVTHSRVLMQVFGEETVRYQLVRPKG
jgi:3',5'-cyclic-AMP phosphodiesterase